MFDWLRQREAKKVWTKYVGSAIRWALTAAGVAGYLGDNEAEQLAGAAVALGSGLWGLYQKWAADQEKKRAAEEAVLKTHAYLAERL